MGFKMAVNTWPNKSIPDLVVKKLGINEDLIHFPFEVMKLTKFWKNRIQEQSLSPRIASSLKKHSDVGAWEIDDPEFVHHISNSKYLHRRANSVDNTRLHCFLITKNILEGEVVAESIAYDCGNPEKFRRVISVVEESKAYFIVAAM